MICDVCGENMELGEIKKYTEVHFWSIQGAGYKLDNHVFHSECFKKWIKEEGG